MFRCEDSPHQNLSRVAFSGSFEAVKYKNQNRYSSSYYMLRFNRLTWFTHALIGREKEKRKVKKEMLLMAHDMNFVDK